MTVQARTGAKLRVRFGNQITSATGHRLHDGDVIELLQLEIFDANWLVKVTDGAATPPYHTYLSPYEITDENFEIAN